MAEKPDVPGEQLGVRMALRIATGLLLLAGVVLLIGGLVVFITRDGDEQMPGVLAGVAGFWALLIWAVVCVAADVHDMKQAGEKK